MRDFSFNPNVNNSLAEPTPAEISQGVMSEAVIEQRFDQDDSSSIRPIHTTAQDDEETTNLPKLIGAAVVAVLAVGGGLYAYQSVTTNHVAAKAVAMKTAPAPKLAASEPAPAPEALPAPEPVQSAAVEAPAAAPVQTAKAVTPGIGIGPTDNVAIDAPMTFTMDNVSPAQKEGSSVQLAEAPAVTAGPTVALKQPVTAPAITAPSEPTASVAQMPPLQ